MARVIGIGGIFFKAKDPDTLRAWYRDRLGVDVADWGGAVFPDADGMTVWSVFADRSEHFAPSTSPFMINYRVDDLDALLGDLRAAGCDVDDETTRDENGSFGWVTDPEGHRVELWQAPAA